MNGLDRRLVADHLKRTPLTEATQLTEAPRRFHAGGGSSGRRGKTWLAERGVGRARQGWRRGGSRWDGFG